MGIKLIIALLLVATSANAQMGWRNPFRIKSLFFAPMFSPTNMPTLFGWWKADALTNAVNGSPIEYWPDSSGHNLHMTPYDGTTSHYPTWTNAVQNGLPAVQYNGVDQWMTNPCIMWQTNCIFFVMQQQAPRSGLSQMYLFGSKPLDYANSFQHFRWLTPEFHTNSAYAGIDLQARGPNTNTTTIVAIQFADDKGIIWTNGILAASNAIGVGMLTNGMIVGSYKSFDAVDYPFTGYLMEMFCATNMFATQDIINGTTAYFRNKWGL